MTQNFSQSKHKTIPDTFKKNRTKKKIKKGKKGEKWLKCSVWARIISGEVGRSNLLMMLDH